MNARSLFLLKIVAMKNRLVIKICFTLPILLFVNYVLMALLGCIACFLGLGNDFYCGPYCSIGKIIFGLTAVLFFFLIFPDIKEIFKIRENASSAEK